MKKILFLVLFLTGIITITAQPLRKKNRLKVPPPVCYASGEIEKSYVPPPPEFFDRLKSGTEKKSNIVVSYSLFPQEAKEAFEYAKSIWEHILESPMPIYVQANWRSKEKSTLASCGPEEYIANFKNAPHKNRYYPIAIAEKITKTELSEPNAPDMTAEFNKNVDWYFGTDGNTPDSLYDFVSTVMHELAHGLGFTGFFYISGELGSYWNKDVGDATAYDILVVKSNGEQLTDTTVYPVPSEKLKAALTSNVLFANSQLAINSNNGIKPRLYAPTEWSGGSSIYHLNDATYRAGNINSLMTHAAGKGEAIHDPGPLTKGIMADIGWEHMYLDFLPLKDVEETLALTFEVAIESDNPIDTTALFVVYSSDAFTSKTDTLPLTWSEDKNIWEAVLVPQSEITNIDYYINAGDSKKRTFYLPTEVPKEVYSIKIGPDIEKPTIKHEQIPYFLNLGKLPEIFTYVEDNLGVDTVYVEYTVNGISQAPFGLSLDSISKYTGVFNFDLEEIDDGDEIAYNIIAEDASNAKNKQIMPLEGKYTFVVEEIFEPAGSYVNDFDNPSRDFILSDFDIYTAKGFENNALHSPHPYLNTGDNDTYWNFTTMLKVPIILFENATMSFDEVVLVEPGEPGTKFNDDEFWDFVIVEASKDTGKTWTPVADGYDSRDNETWVTNYNSTIEDQNSNASGTSDWFVTREIDMLQNPNLNVGDTCLIRFRLLSDALATGWGWAIDNLRIQQPVSALYTALSPGNVHIYPNPFSRYFNLSINPRQETQRIDIEVYNMHGEKFISIVKENFIGTLSEKIDLSNQSNGMYFISVRENGKNIISKKIIKK